MNNSLEDAMRQEVKMGEPARKLDSDDNHARIGKGLAALLGGPKTKSTKPQSMRENKNILPPAAATPSIPVSEQKVVMDISVTKIHPNAYQPRREFRPDELERLANSIKESGVLQPVIVRKSEDGYELIAGERRLRATKLAGLDIVPAIVRETKDNEMPILALIENIHRDNLGPLELARAYAALMQKFGLKQEEVSLRLGVSRSSIANTLRLLELPEAIKDLIVSGKLSAGHARAILGVGGDKARILLATKILKDDLSVRQAEELAKNSMSNTPLSRKPSTSGSKESPAHLRTLENKLGERLNTKVKIIEGSKKSQIVIDFYDAEEFDRIQKIIMGVAS